MKKLIVITLVILSFVFLDAAPWEGAATVAPAGDLPDTGFYIATNSFPKNSLVDITNIETGKTTRAIVSNSLNSPGLLATVSREAADLIGMRAGSVSRIRMIQPVEPTAYSRFTDGIASGNPVYDSGSVKEETYSAPAASVPSSSTPVAGTPSTGTSAGTPTSAPETSTPAASSESASPVLSDLKGPSYLLEPEWASKERLAAAPPAEETPPEIAEMTAEEPYEEVAETPEEIVEAPYDEYEYDYFDDPYNDPYDSPYDEAIAETPSEEANKEIIDEIAKAKEDIIDEIEKAKEEIIDELAKIEESNKTAENAQGQGENPAEYKHFVIVPAEERPPEKLYGIDPNDIIPGISRTTPEKETQAITNNIVPPVTPSASENIFSARRVTSLDRGKYYVQLAAFDSAEPVENALKKIDNRYEPVIYKDGDAAYRILLGPLNQGESAAILQRFKSIGYNDAFVRYVR